MNPEYPQHKNILILGASGYTGTAVVDLLNKFGQSNRITLVQHQKTISPTQFKIIQGSLESLSLQQIKESNPDIVIHLARLNATKFGSFGRRWQASKGYKANIKLLNHLNQLNKKVRLIYLSGSLVYGEGVHGEYDEPNPVSFAREYFHAEKPFLKVHSEQLEIMIIRAPWILGDGSWFKSFYLNVIQNKKFIPSYSHPNFKMMFIGLHDCASVILQLACTSHCGIFNLFCNKPILYVEFLAELKKKFPTLPIKEIQFSSFRNKAVHEAFHCEILMQSERNDILSSISLQQADIKLLIQESLNRFTENK